MHALVILFASIGVIFTAVFAMCFFILWITEAGEKRLRNKP